MVPGGVRRRAGLGAEDGEVVADRQVDERVDALGAALRARVVQEQQRAALELRDLAAVRAELVDDALGSSRVPARGQLRFACAAARACAAGPGSSAPAPARAASSRPSRPCARRPRAATSPAAPASDPWSRPARSSFLTALASSGSDRSSAASDIFFSALPSIGTLNRNCDDRPQVPPALDPPEQREQSRARRRRRRG